MGLFKKKRNKLFIELDRLLKRAEKTIKKGKDLSEMSVDLANFVSKSAAVTIKLSEIREHKIEIAGIMDEIKEIANQIKVLERQGLNSHSLEKMRVDFIPRLRRLKIKEKGILTKLEKFKKEKLDEEKLEQYEMKVFAAMRRLSGKIEKITDGMRKEWEKDVEETDVVLNGLLKGTL